jgi:hypothetical protein
MGLEYLHSGSGAEYRVARDDGLAGYGRNRGTAYAVRFERAERVEYACGYDRGTCISAMRDYSNFRSRRPEGLSRPMFGQPTGRNESAGDRSQFIQIHHRRFALQG